MTLELTRKERNTLYKLMNSLYRTGVEDERAAAAFYRRMSEKLRNIGLYIEADVLVTMAESEEIHKDILNEIIADIREKVIVSQFTKETTLKDDRTFVSMIGKLSKK